MWNDDFLTQEEIELSRTFEREGFVIAPVSDLELFEQIQREVALKAAALIDVPIVEPESFLNGFHELVQVKNLNDLRVEIIRQINSEPWFRGAYFKLARPILEVLVGNELAMQQRVNLSIQMPNEDGSLLPVHSDVWSGDSPYEVVVWLPLVECFQTKSMYLLPPKASADLHEEFAAHAQGSSEDLFKSIEKEITWIRVNSGEVMVFNQNLPHGNRVNEEAETRWSMNCRFKSIFTPYGDKKVGEFFEPITLRSASRIGMNYRFPKLESDEAYE